MPVELTATAEGRVLIEPYWPGHLNEDNYGRTSAERLEHAANIERTIDELTASLAQADASSDGATSEAFQDATRRQIAALSADRDKANAVAAATAADCQNIFNTKNLLNALAADYQNRWDELTAENIATGGTQPQIQAAITALKQIAQIAAQTVAGGFGAAHEQINQHLAARQLMTQAPAMMPPSLPQTPGMGAGWGAAPMMPAQYAQNPGFVGTPAGSPMIGGGDFAGASGSLLASLVNGAPQMLSQVAGPGMGAGGMMGGPMGGGAGGGMPMAGGPMAGGGGAPAGGGAPGSGGGAGGMDSPVGLLQQAASTVTAGISGAAEALGAALQDGPLADNARELQLPETSPTGGDTDSAGDGPAGGAGAPAGGKGGGHGQDATHLNLGPVDVEMHATADVTNTGVDAQGSVHAEVASSHLTSDTLSAPPASSLTGATATPLSAALPATGMPGPVMMGGPMTSTPAPAAGADTARVSGGSHPVRGTSTPPRAGDDVSAPTGAVGRGDEPTARQRATATLVGLAAAGETAAVAVYDDRDMVVTAHMLGMPLTTGDRLPATAVPLAMALDATASGFFADFLGATRVDVVMMVAVGAGLIDTPNLVLAAGQLAGDVPDVEYLTDADITGTTPAAGTAHHPQWPRLADTDIDHDVTDAMTRWQVPGEDSVPLADIVDGLKARAWADEQGDEIHLAAAWWAARTAGQALRDGHIEYAGHIAWLMRRLPDPLT